MAEELFQESPQTYWNNEKEIYLLQFGFKFIYILQVKYYY